MKKIALAFLATAAVAGSISTTSADVRTGFYVGATAAMNSNVNKTKITDSSTGFKATYQLGKHQPGAGAYVGYGFLSSCYYFAGEFAYNFNNYHSKSKTNNTVTMTRLKFKNDHIFNFAVLLGRKLTPSTLGYIRLGVNWSEFEMKPTVNSILVKRQRGKTSFCPGLGLQTWLNRNINVRLEYTHDFGSDLHRTRTVGATKIAVKMNNSYTHSVKLGVAWVF